MVELFCRHGSGPDESSDWFLMVVKLSQDVMLKVMSTAQRSLQRVDTQEVTSHSCPEGLELLRELQGCGHWAQFFWKWSPHKQLPHLLRRLPPSTGRKQTTRERRKLNSNHRWCVCGPTSRRPPSEKLFSNKQSAPYCCSGRMTTDEKSSIITIYLLQIFSLR